MVYAYDKFKEEELERLMNLARLNSQNNQIRSNKEATSTQNQNQESSEDASPGVASQNLEDSSSYQEGREIEISAIFDGQGQIKQEVGVYRVENFMKTYIFIRKSYRKWKMASLF